jgi:hypothetical protein
MAYSKAVFLIRRAAARYWARASIIPDPRLIRKNLPSRGLTKVENHYSKANFQICSKKVFILQKKIARIMTGVKSRNSCRDLFKRLENLAFSCEYLYSLINFITNNLELFQINADVHSIYTRHKHCLHKPTTNLSYFQKSAYRTGIKIFNKCHWISKVLWRKKQSLK